MLLDRIGDTVFNVPMVVKAAAAQAKMVRVPPNRVTPCSTVRTGDFRLVEPPPGAGGDVRLGLVLNVDPKLGFSEVALVHAFPELAISVDAVVPRALTAAPYIVVVQTDLRGVVWTKQVQRLVGRMSTSTLKEVSDLVASGVSESVRGIQTGTVLEGLLDRRWQFKTTEGAALAALTADSTQTLLEQMDC